MILEGILGRIDPFVSALLLLLPASVGTDELREILALRISIQGTFNSAAGNLDMMPKLLIVMVRIQ